MISRKNKTLRAALAVVSLCLVGAISEAAGASEVTKVRGLDVEVVQASILDCKKFLKKSAQPDPEQDLAQEEREDRRYDLCFSTSASKTPKLTLGAQSADLLRNIVIKTSSLGVPGNESTSTVMQAAERKTWSQDLAIPRAPTGTPETSPDAPLLKGGAKSFFDRKPQEPGFLRPGFYRVDVIAGSGDSAESMTLGIEVRGAKGEKKASQWAFSNGAARLLVPGCFKQQLDPVVELSLESCDDPRYKIKAVVAKREGGLTIGNYVDNSLAVYEKIWHLKSRLDQTGDPKFIRLELLQLIAGKQDFLLKYFVELGEEVMVVTFYGPVDEERKLRRRFGELEDWLMLTPVPADS